MKTLLPILILLLGVKVHSQPPKKTSRFKTHKPFIKHKKFSPQEGKGYVFATSYQTKEIKGTSSLTLKKVNDTKFFYDEYKFLANPNLFIKTNSKNMRHIDDETNIKLIELEPGEYEFYKWGVNSSNSTYYSKIPSFYKFEVFPNKITYVGNFHFYMEKYIPFNIGKTYYANGGFVEIKDEFKRDTSYLKSYFKNFLDMEIVKNDIDRFEFQYQSKKENIRSDYRFSSDTVGVLVGTVTQDFEASIATILYFTGKSESDAICSYGFDKKQLAKIKLKNDSLPEKKVKYFFIELPVGDYNIDEFKVIDFFKPDSFDSKIDVYSSTGTNIKFTIKPKQLSYLCDFEIISKEDENSGKVKNISLKFNDKYNELDKLLNENSISKFVLNKENSNLSEAKKVIFQLKNTQLN